MDNTRTPEAGFIAVVGQWRPSSPEFGKLPLPYAHAVKKAGGSPVIVSTFPIPDEADNPERFVVRQGFEPTDASALDGAAALVVPGGGDIDPEWYGQKPHPRTVHISHQRDRFELTLIEAALDGDMPVLAICHGMQLLNVQQGGTLVQHLADRDDILEHDRDRPRAEPAHELRTKPGSRLAEVLGERTLVNSHHHQGLGLVAPALEEVGWAEDGVLEAVVGREHEWLVGVQWHPEAMAPVDRRQLGLFEAFVDAGRSYSHRTGLTARTA